MALMNDIQDIAEVRNDLVWLNRDPWEREHRFRESFPGRRKDIEGAPLAQWSIIQAELPADAIRPHVWPDGDAGTVEAFVGDYVIDPERRRIFHRPRDHFDYHNVSDSLRTVKALRDSGEGDFGRAEFASDYMVEHYEVVRCDVAECQTFGGFHSTHRRTEHIRLDMSTKDYTCRIVMDHGVWIPEISWRRIYPSPESIASYVSDAHWLLSELRKLGGPVPSLTR